MNYEKKYKDALERAKEKYAMFEGMKQGDILEDVFPELKESEDEGIKNAIHIYLDWLDGRKDYQPKGEYSIRDMIAWLEKQGEHQKFVDSIQIGDKVTRNRDGVLVNLSQLNRVAKKDEKQGEQKPAWSEEDEKMFNSALWHIKNSCGNQGKNSGEFEVYNWLKTIKYRYLPQPKHEWSEEDEETLKIIDRDLQEFYSRRKAQAGSPLFESQMQNIRWLKSLKDRYTWKPSDEQINALQTALGIVGELTSTASLLKEIREQLKKLR